MRYFVLVFTALIFTALLGAAEIRGRCTRVSDGDTCTVQETDGTRFRIRLCAIDAPEKDQPHGQEAKAALAALLLDKEVVVTFRAVDRYGRILGTVTVEGRDAAQEMLREGHAWHYGYFDSDPANSALQSEAEKAGKGLWKEKNPVPPWEYRQSKKARSEEDE